MVHVVGNCLCNKEQSRLCMRAHVWANATPQTVLPCRILMPLTALIFRTLRRNLRAWLALFLRRHIPDGSFFKTITRVLGSTDHDETESGNSRSAKNLDPQWIFLCARIHERRNQSIVQVARPLQNLWKAWNFLLWQAFYCKNHGIFQDRTRNGQKRIGSARNPYTTLLTDLVCGSESLRGCYRFGQTLLLII